MLMIDLPSYFDLDEDHPIPNLEVVDINTVKRNGGSDLFIIVATPLRGDRRSLERLRRKLEVYLLFVNSKQFRDESGIPTPENTSIVVRIHPDSDPLTFELLERNRRWVTNNNASLIVDTNSLSRS
jgi:hypothetical protein